MPRLAAPLVLLAALSAAPYQCGSEADPALAIEETPGQALYELAEQFRDRGDQDAWQQTLEHLIERYPNSRFAVAARQDLANAGVATTEADGAAGSAE